jgi:mannosyltransferase OCH1-like enzyme
MPNGTELHFFLQASPELDENVQMISKELDKIGIHGAYKAFKMLRPHSYKSDLFRFMNLWYYGGVYMDGKMGLDMPADNWIDFDHDEFLYCPDRLGTVNCPVIAMT